MGCPAAKEVSRLKWSSGSLSAGHRTIAEEVPVALTYDGSTYAVMMATPSDLPTSRSASAFLKASSTTPPKSKASKSSRSKVA